MENTCLASLSYSIFCHLVVGGTSVGARVRLVKRSWGAIAELSLKVVFFTLVCALPSSYFRVCLVAVGRERQLWWLLRVVVRSGWRGCSVEAERLRRLGGSFFEHSAAKICAQGWCLGARGPSAVLLMSISVVFCITLGERLHVVELGHLVLSFASASYCMPCSIVNYELWPRSLG